MPEPFFGAAQLQLDVLHVETTNILEFDALEQIPNAFLRIQFRSIGWQAFEMNAFGSPFRQKVFDRLTAMNGGSIPDHQQFAGDLAGEHLQKAHNLRAFVRMVLSLHQQLALRGNATNRREMVTGLFDAQYGRLTNWCIRGNCQWQQVKSGFIYENDGALFGGCLFFNASYRSSFHLWIALSSRWVAFWMGFC
jgi:hypothetical protein